MEVYHNSFFAMGSRFNAVFPFNNQEICEHIYNSIQNEVLRIEFKLSYFDQNSEVSKINNTAYSSTVKLDSELFNILKTCIDYSKITSGAYDITLRPIIEYIEGNGKAPNPGKQSYLDQIELDEANKSIHFGNDKVKIDFGGFGKGYALEKVKLLLDNSPIENAFISFGESSIFAKGKHPRGDCWQVGIKNFFDAKDSLHTFNLSNSSISSSGNYYIDDTGQLCSKVNVINPASGKCVDELSVVSIKSDSPLEAEILSTAFLVMEDENIYKIMDRFKNVEAIKIHYSENKPIKTIY
jgi:FAD:protein FMN transferase